MQIDDVVWSIINKGQCSFKMKTITQNFCRNKYNLTGLCNKSSCPLANSNYATILEERGKLYLFIKTIERAQTPAKLWEKILLDKNYEKSILQIDELLPHWAKFITHKCKQRVTKLRQMLNRMRKLKLKGYKEFIVVKQKAARRDKIREAAALNIAHIEENIEKELLERLQSGTYGDLYNLNPSEFEKQINELDEESEGALFVEEFEEENIPQDLAEEYLAARKGETDLEDILGKKIAKKLKTFVKKGRKRPKINVEFEKELPEKQQIQN